MSSPAILILAYDAECPRCRRFVDWVQARDTRGLVIPFPLQNPELARMAPELAGLPLDLAMHGLDAGTRTAAHGRELVREIALRIPGWRALAWTGPLLLLTPFQALAHVHTLARGR